MNALACTTCGEPLVTMGKDVETTLVGCQTEHPCGGEHDKNCVTRAAWCAAGHCTCLSLLRRCNDHEPERSWGREVEDCTPKCDWHGKETCSACGPWVLVDAWPDLPIRSTRGGRS